MNKKQIQDNIDSIIANLVQLKQNLGGSTDEIKMLMEDDLNTFEKLKNAVLNSDRWPEAVNKHLVCDPDNEQDKIERGRGIIELMIEERMPNVKFLDYGCGEGHTVAYAAQEKASLSVGYDPKTYDWSKFGVSPNQLFTNSFGDVVQHGPFDIILLFDVLDHLEEETPSDVLKKIASLLKPTGKVYMRVHPYTSRHATHLYHHLNKAYLHLVFTEDELKELVPEQNHAIKNIGPIYPLMSYSNLIKEAGLKETSRREIKEPAEIFFKSPSISQRIIDNTTKKEFPEFQMGLQFIDYNLAIA